MTRYIKITVESLPCDACSGQGFRWETLYHNQAKKCKCYICSGTGKRMVELQEDVTEQIQALIENKPIS